MHCHVEMPTSYLFVRGLEFLENSRTVCILHVLISAWTSMYVYGVFCWLNVVQ